MHYVAELPIFAQMVKIVFVCIL